MKTRKLFLSLIISGVTLGSAYAQRPITDPASATNASASRNASRHIGDDAVAESGVQTKFRTVQYEPGEDQSSQSQSAQSEQHSQHQAQPQDYSLAPTAMSYQSQVGNACCGDQVYSSCNMGRGGRQYFNDYCAPSMWFGAETLLWWGQERNAPPLLTTAPTTVLPVNGTTDVTTVVGGANGIDSGLLPGYRFSAGKYFGPEQRVGVSGRVFGIFRNSDTTTRSGDGIDQSVGLPFFNTLIGLPDAYLVAFNNGLPVATGTASVTSELDLIAAEPSMRFLVSDSCDHRIEMLGGYTYLRLKDSLGISSTSVDTFTGNLIPDGTVFETRDLFAAENNFHGGHIGLQSSVARKRLSLTTLTKVSIGNMHQSGSISGSTAVGLPPAVPTVTTGGIYTQQSNIGDFSRDTFAFIPEMGIKGGLAIRNNVQLTAGYTFLYISKAALAGNQIDPNLDLTQAQGGAAALQPGFNYREGSMWFQGLDLGVNWTF